MKTLIETLSFTKTARRLMGDDNLESLKDVIAYDPETGGLIKDTGGFRKIRGRRVGSGKSGGVRVFYYATKVFELIYLVLCIPKADDAPLTKEQKKVLRGLADEFDIANVYDIARVRHER